jgi:hypothetical protein
MCMIFKPICPISTNIEILHPSYMTLQSLLSPGLSQMAPPFFSISSFSPTSCSVYQKLCPFPYTQIIFYLSDPSDASLRFCRLKTVLRGKVGLTPNPRLEDQVIPCCLGHHIWRVWHGMPYQSLRYRQHRSHDHLTTQAPPLHQSRDTFGGRKLECVHKF